MEQPQPQPQPLRVALVLSGAVALGTFEAGVVHELMAAMDQGVPMTLDLVAGASAGGLVGTVAVRSLVTGSAFGPGLERWTEVTLKELTRGYERPSQARRRHKPLDTALLSSEYVRQLIREYVVQGRDRPPFRPWFPAPRVALVMPLTNLDGLPGTGLPGDEYRYGEAVTFHFEPGAGTGRALQSEAVWERVALVAMAGASFPGAFDPEQVDWQQRLLLEEVTETWENDRLLAQLEERYPGLQARFRYADGGILDNQPLERAISGLTRVTGQKGEAGPHGLLFDARRCFIFVEPHPPVTVLQQVIDRRKMDLLAIVARAVRLWDIAASPYVSRRRVLAVNQRILNLWRYLALLGRRFQEEHSRGMDPAEGDVAALLSDTPLADSHFTPGVAPPGGVGTGEAAGEEATIPPERFAEAIDDFYAWLADPQRFEADRRYLQRRGAEELAGQQEPVWEVLAELREVYLRLCRLDAKHPDRYPRLLREAHRRLALDLGLNRPWVLLSYVAPEKPRLSLRGEEAVHFGGFFSRNFLRHDYEVGRYYARQWLRQAFPEWEFREPVPAPELSEEGVGWPHVLDNALPLQRMTGRLLAATGFPYAGPVGRVTTVVLAVVLAMSGGAALVWALAVPIWWVTGDPELLEALPVLSAAGALFPLALLGLVLAQLPDAFFQALWERAFRHRERR